jgi:hypothetical protein
MAAPSPGSSAGATETSVRACAAGSTTPLLASVIAGSTTRCQGRRPHRRCTSPQPAGTPGTPTLAPPMEYVCGTPPKNTSIGTIGPGAMSPSRPGTEQKKSRHVTVCVAAS